MKRYEYEVHESETDEVINVLNKRGAEGWRLVDRTLRYDRYTGLTSFLLEREVDVYRHKPSTGF